MQPGKRNLAYDPKVVARAEMVVAGVIDYKEGIESYDSGVAELNSVLDQPICSPRRLPISSIPVRVLDAKYVGNNVDPADVSKIVNGIKSLRSIIFPTHADYAIGTRLDVEFDSASLGGCCWWDKYPESAVVTPYTIRPRLERNGQYSGYCGNVEELKALVR